MADQFDLDANFKRIGFAGAARADLATLKALQGRHVATIPFENLNPLMGLPVDLDRAALQAKLVGHRRGGYCFAQNALSAAVGGCADQRRCAATRKGDLCDAGPCATVADDPLGATGCGRHCRSTGPTRRRCPRQANA